jgi:Family of unknown function (DUF6236)
MAHEVLYFPYISVPQDAWFTRVLLYWDKVGSIVPAPYVRQPGQLSPYMQELLAADLVAPVVPEYHDGPLYAPMECFLQFLDEEQSQEGTRGKPLGLHPASRGAAAEAGTVFQIHRGKLGDLVAEGLLERGLARRVEGEDWYEVESRTAAHFMAYLAVTLGARVAMDPITDSAAHLAAFSSAPGASDTPAALLEGMRASVLEEMLPAPAQSVRVSDLAEFRERHGDLLSKFRREIENRLIDLALVQEEWARSKKLALYKEELKETIAEIQARMHERKWRNIVFGTVCGLIAAAIPGARAAVTGDLTGVGLQVPAFVAAVSRGMTELRPTWNMNSPLAYAALAQEHLSSGSTKGASSEPV